MRIVIFGVGGFYRERKYKIPAMWEIVAFLDNNPKLQGQKMDGVLILAPGNVSRLSYDKIVLMSASEEAMKDQLLKLGIDRKDIWYWEQLASEICRGEFKLYCGGNYADSCKKKILIVSSHLNYTGGPLAAVYAARVLQERGYAVFVAAPSGDEAFIEEMTEGGIRIVLCPALPYIHSEELAWIELFDAVLVNVFPMIPSACEISRIKPVLWWIHESERKLYENILHRFEGQVGGQQLEKVNIRAVSRVAQNRFNYCFPDRIRELLSYGIPDEKKENSFSYRAEPLVFAIIGMVHQGKAQDVFVRAVTQLPREEKRNLQFLIIGPIGTDAYAGSIREMASEEPSIKITGLLTRSEIHKAFEKIDVVVCPSLEDSLPIVVTEGMMYGKICIVSEATGTADYIKHGKNGLICKAGDPEDLCEKMRWVIGNRENLQEMGNAARQVYEKYFTMDRFGDQLEKALTETLDGSWRIE